MRNKTFAGLAALALGLALCAQDGPPAMAQTSGTAAPPLIRMNLLPPLPFTPFTMADLTNSPLLQADGQVHLPNGSIMTPQSYLDALNQLEPQFNTLGYSLHGAPGTVVLQQAIVDYSRLQTEANQLAQQYLPSDPSRLPPPSTVDSLARELSSLLPVDAVSSGLVYNRATQTFVGTITITNTTTQSLTGPFQVVLSHLTTGVTLVNASGMHQGDPYRTVTTTSLAPGASVSVPVQFRNPSAARLSYTVLTYSGGF